MEHDVWIDPVQFFPMLYTNDGREVTGDEVPEVERV